MIITFSQDNLTLFKLTLFKLTLFKLTLQDLWIIGGRRGRWKSFIHIIQNMAKSLPFFKKKVFYAEFKSNVLMFYYIFKFLYFEHHFCCKKLSLHISNIVYIFENPFFRGIKVVKHIVAKSLQTMTSIGKLSQFFFILFPLVTGFLNM